MAIATLRPSSAALRDAFAASARFLIAVAFARFAALTYLADKGAAVKR